MSEALTFIAASLDLPAQTDKCEATLSTCTPGSLGRAGGGQEAAICGRAPLVHVQEVRASATREAVNALWQPCVDPSTTLSSRSTLSRARAARLRERGAREARERERERESR